MLYRVLRLETVTAKANAPVMADFIDDDLLGDDPYDEDGGEFLTGRLLVAMPGIEDPRFERTVPLKTTGS